MFTDEVKLKVKAGDGGNGCMSFRREKFVPRGGPNGGDGGNGGNVIFEADDRYNTLFHVSHLHNVKAGRGQHGMGKDMHGKSGDDVVIKVPPGTLVRDAETRVILKDLDTVGAQVIVAKGGRGGRGNARFKSATNQAPRRVESGNEGEAREIFLELKVLADVGLVGFPNAGKSTLLSRLSGARPKIADYPFTTLDPHLGIVDAGDYRSFVMADLPGLIEGAHEGHGLGDRFLRHIERTRVILHLIDPVPPDGRDPVDAYHAIRKELEAYSPKLAEKHEIVVVSKLDLPDAEEVAERIRQELGVPVIPISAVANKGLDRLIHAVLDLLENGPEA
jgi:GTP-binding protein